MIARIVFSAGLVAIAMHAQTARPVSSKPAQSSSGQQPGSPPPAANLSVIPSHVTEPIVIRDGSVKVDIYSTSDTAVVIENSNTVVANGSEANKGRLLVPVRVVPAKTGPGAIGRLQTISAFAHPLLPVRRYVYEVQKLEGDKFVPYSELVFLFAKNTWRIAPKGSNPLQLNGCGAPVALTGDWANHFQSTCEYGYRDLHLRLGSVTVDTGSGSPTKINLATGCSEFRIEPFNHPNHRMPFDHPSCGGLRLDPARAYPIVQVKGGVHPIQAIDVSLAKPK